MRQSLQGVILTARRVFIRGGYIRRDADSFYAPHSVAHLPRKESKWRCRVRRDIRVTFAHCDPTRILAEAVGDGVYLDGADFTSWVCHLFRA